MAVAASCARYEGNHRVLFRDDTGKWYVISFGLDSNGSRNVITLFGGSDKGFLENRLQGIDNVVKRNMEK